MKTATPIRVSAWIVAASLSLTIASALAQQEAPAVQFPTDTPTPEPGPISVAPPDSPRAATPPAASQQASAPQGGDTGTTIVGDKEAPIGLFITPWKDEYADHGLDRPARFVDVDTGPIDPDTFQRRINYYNVINDYRESHLASGK